MTTIDELCKYIPHIKISIVSAKYLLLDIVVGGKEHLSYIDILLRPTLCMTSRYSNTWPSN